MDMFMDKLAQKLTAQEIIKANTAADVEELNRLKNQIAEYNECVTRLQKLIDDGFGKVAEVRERENTAGQLAEENAEGIRSLQKEAKDILAILGQAQERLAGMDKAVAGQLESLSESLGEKVDLICGQLEAQASGPVFEKLDGVEENVHKECVKVYRNVQAVLVEESGKQTENLNELKGAVASLKGRTGAVLGISAAALILSMGAVLLQLLVMAGLV